MKVFIIKHVKVVEIAFKYDEKIIGIFKRFSNIVFNATYKKWYCDLDEVVPLVKAFKEAKIEVIFSDDDSDNDQEKYRLVDPHHYSDTFRQKKSPERQKRINNSPDKDYYSSRKKQLSISPEKQYSPAVKLSVNVTREAIGGLSIQLPIEINTYKKLKPFKGFEFHKTENKWIIAEDNVEEFYDYCLNIDCKVNNN